MSHIFKSKVTKRFLKLFIRVLVYILARLVIEEIGRTKKAGEVKVIINEIIGGHIQKKKEVPEEKGVKQISMELEIKHEGGEDAGLE